MSPRPARLEAQRICAHSVCATQDGNAASGFTQLGGRKRDLASNIAE
jgi:hypothetical protein